MHLTKKVGGAVLLNLAGIFLFTLLASAQGPIETKRVLILITGQKDVPGYILSEKGLRAALDLSRDFQIEYFMEYMDAYRFTDDSYKKNLLNLYRNKYSTKNIDLVFAHGFNALDFAANHGDDIFPETPIVYSTVLQQQVERLNLDDRYTGSLLEIDYLGLLNTALEIHPDTRHVAIISGTSRVGRLLEDRSRKAYAPYAEKYDFIYPGQLPMNDLLARMAMLPDKSIIIYYHLALDGNSQPFKPWKVASMISETANAPLYGFADTYIGKGIVGGTLISYEAQGKHAGEIGLRILMGEKPADIPPSAAGTILNMFDWRQLKRWNIDESNLPQDSIVRHTELSFWGLYRLYIIVGVCLVIFQGGVIWYLFDALRKNRVKDILQQESDERYRAFVENSSEGIWCVDFEVPIPLDLPEEEQFELVYQHGYISMANDAYARAMGFGYGDQLVGTRIEQFCPRSDPINVATVMAWVKHRYTIKNAETVETYKDGITRNILNNSTGIINSGYVERVWGTQLDITELKQIQKALRQSKDFNRAILNSIEYQVCVLDKDGFIISVNESWMDFARDNGADLSAVCEGINYLDCCASGGEQRVSTAEGTSAAEAKKGISDVLHGVSNRFKIEYPCHSPITRRWFEMEAIPFKGKKGGVVVTHRDISSQKLLEESLVETEQKYRTVADFTYDWEYWEALSGLEYVSPSCERITGYSTNDFFERPELISEIIIPEDQKIWNAHGHGENACTVETPCHCHFRIKHKNGEIRWIGHVCQPVYTPDGDFNGVRSSNRDITELRNSERMASEHLAILSSLDRRATLGQLTGSIAHELNQPLTGILSDAQAGEMLLDRERFDKAQIKEIFSDIISDTKRASQVIQNLRELFRGQVVPSDPVDINSLIIETIQLLNSEFVNQNVIVHTNLTTDVPKVIANKAQLQQVLINMIHNACQAMQTSQKADRRLSIKTTRVDDSLMELCLVDNGHGIEPDHLKSIFEPFSQSEEGGMGMGLAISNSILRAHNGKIWAENNPDGGATFHISLPIQR